MDRTLELNGSVGSRPANGPERRRPPWGLTLPQLWAAVAVLLPVIIALQAPTRAGDAAYQIRLGNLMLAHHHLIRADPLTFTAFGRPWTNQQWGAGIIFALVDRAGGWNALGVFRSLLVGLTFLFVFLACRASGAGPRRAAGLTLTSFAVAVSGVAGLLSLRPQSMALVLFAATVWIVAARRRRPGAMWAIPALAAVWANLHGSFFLAPLLVGLAWLEDRHDRSPLAHRTLVVGLATAAATLVNPFGPGVWRYAFDLTFNSSLSRSIQEWQPATIRDPVGAALVLSGVVVVVLLARRGPPTPWPALVSLGVFFALALPAARGIYWWALAAPPVLAGIFRDRVSTRPPELGHRSVNTSIAAALVAFAVALPFWHPVTPATRLVTDAPVGVTRELRAALPAGARIFASQKDGSWIELNLPRDRVFIDTRFELFPQSVWRQYLDVSLGREGWQAILDRWRVGAVFADPKDQRLLMPEIRRDPGWRMVYSDRDGSVYVRSA